MCHWRICVISLKTNNWIINNIETLFADTDVFEDMREYYYMIRSALDDSFDAAVENIVLAQKNAEQW